MAFETGLAVVFDGGSGVSFGVKVVPGSSRTAFAGLYNAMLKVKISVAPERGKANNALVKFLSEKLRISRRLISITSGRTGTVKQIAISSITVDDFLARLQNCL